MAAAYIRVFVDGKRLRTFGGNKSDVRREKQWYETASYEQILRAHPRLTREQAKRLCVEYVRKG